VLEALGDLPSAKAAYERALKIFQKLLGDDHPNTRLVRGNIDSLSP
jgi:Tetratricopeptide repeat